jgi:predicted HD superfamily hydrolase involved in NAD metabolism
MGRRHKVWLARAQTLTLSDRKKESPKKRLFSRKFSSSDLCPGDYRECVRALVTPERFEHILRVTVFAEEIAQANGFGPADVLATRVAAMLHDVARDLEAQEIFQLAPPESALEQQNPLTVHGRAGRAIAERWGVADTRVLEAISGHVFGVPKKNRIGMVVYVADVSEPGRGVNSEVRELAAADLFRAYGMAIEAKVRYLRSKGKVVHPETLKTYEEISSSE